MVTILGFGDYTNYAFASCSCNDLYSLKEGNYGKIRRQNSTIKYDHKELYRIQDYSLLAIKRFLVIYFKVWRFIECPEDDKISPLGECLHFRQLMGSVVTILFLERYTLLIKDRLSHERKVNDTSLHVCFSFTHNMASVRFVNFKCILHRS